MITSRKLSRRGLFGLSIPMTIAASKNFLPAESLPERKFEIGDRVRTERICNDRISSNYGGVDWECGLVVGYCWEYDEEWLVEDFRRGWTYWIRFDQSNRISNCSDLSLDFVHETELVAIRNYSKSSWLICTKKRTTRCSNHPSKLGDPSLS